MLPFSRKSRSVSAAMTAQFSSASPVEAPEMRQRDDLRMILQLRSRKVADVRAQLAAIQRLEHRGLIDDAAAREIQNDAALSACSFRRAALTRPRVASSSGTCTVTMSQRAEQIVERQRLFDARRQLPCTLHGDLRIETQHSHPKRMRRVRDFDADRAETDDAERATGQFVADELLLALLDRFIELVIVALAAGARIPTPGRCCAPRETGSRSPVLSPHSRSRPAH